MPHSTEMVTVDQTPGGPTMFKIVVRDNPTASLLLGSSPGGWAMSPDGVTLIVALSDVAQLVYIDTETSKEIKRIDLPFKPGVLAYQGKRLFVAVQGASLLNILDLDTGAVKKEVKIPDGTVTDVPTPRTYDAVLLVSFGGPQGPDDVLPFLRNVTRGRGVPPERKNLPRPEHSCP